MLIFAVFLPLLCHGERGKSATDFFKGADSYTGLSFVTDGDVSVKADCGVRFRFSDATFILAAGLPSGKISSLPEIFGCENPLDVIVPRVGLGLSFSPVFLPFSIEANAGTLGFSGALSRMKSPDFSIGSALSSPYRPSGGISSSLPTFTSSRHPLAFSLLLSSSGKSLELPSVFFGLSEQKELFLSIYKSFSLWHIPVVSLSLNGGLFRHSREYNSSWFQKQRPYPEDGYFCAEIESSLVWSFFRHWAAASAVQCPYGGFDFWFRCADSLVLDGFTLNTAFFASTPGLITASGSVPGTLLELMLNPQVSFSLCKSKVQAGLSALGELDDEKNMEMKFRFDGSIQNARFRTALSASSSLVPDSESGGVAGDFSSRIYASCKFRSFSCSSSLSLKCTESSKTFSASASVTPAHGFVKSLSSDFSLSIKNGMLSGTSVSAGMELCKKWEKISVTGKFSAKLKNTY